MDGVRLADGLRPGFGQAEVLHFARSDQLTHGAGHVFDRHVGVDAVLVQHVHVVGAQVTEAVVEYLADVLRACCRCRIRG